MGRGPPGEPLFPAIPAPGADSEQTREEALPQDFPDHPVLLSGGQAASPGIAVGQVYLAEGDPSACALPDDAILVARTASPDHARLMGKMKGIITDIGSVTSHLASVAREFGVPALFDVGQATARLSDGEPITLVAGRGEDRASSIRASSRNWPRRPSPQAAPVRQSPAPAHADFLDKVAPLNLTDPQDPSFAPSGCQTIHDVIRFAHEKVVKEMFGLSGDAAEGVISVKLTTDIPLVLHLVDLGGGLKTGLTTCDDDHPGSPGISYP